MNCQIRDRVSGKVLYGVTQTVTIEFEIGAVCNLLIEGRVRCHRCKSKALFKCLIPHQVKTVQWM